jgi:hypothetical protein
MNKTRKKKVNSISFSQSVISWLKSALSILFESYKINHVKPTGNYMYYLC